MSSVSVEKEYISCDSDEILNVYKNGLHRPSINKNGSVRQKPGPTRRYLSATERKQMIKLVSDGLSKRNAREKLGISYQIFHNTYYNNEDESFRYELDDARCAASEKLRYEGWKLAKDGDKDLIIHMMNREDRRDDVVLGHQKFLISENNRVKLAEMQAAKASSSADGLIQTFPILQESLAECVDQAAACKVIGIYAAKLEELAKRLESESSQKAIETTCTVEE